MIRILLAEDQALVRGALKALLDMEYDIEVVRDVQDGKAALNAIEDIGQEGIDIVLTDIEMPNMTGIELTQAIKQKYPDLKIAIVTTFGRAGYIKRAMESGVSAFLLKDAPSDKLAQTLREVLNGRKVIDPELAVIALDDKDPLTDKERKALKLAGEGKKTAEIAGTLFLSEGTVRNYLSEAIAKLNATNRIDAARIAEQKGWL